MEFCSLLIPAAVIYAAMSLVCFALFAWDKRAAQSRRRRIPESTLHTTELLGGWPGAFLAMHVIRHKSAKHRYRLVTILIALAHLAAWVGLFLLL